MNTYGIPSQELLVNKFSQKRWVLKSQLDNNKAKPFDGRKSIPDELCRYLVEKLISSGIGKEEPIGIIDYYLQLSTFLVEYGFTNLYYIEDEIDLDSLEYHQEIYYNKLKEHCDNSNIKYVTNWRDMNFSAVIGNPPFSGQLHLEFLLDLLTRSDYVSLIHPSGWLTRSDRQIEKDVKKSLDGRLKSLKIFNGAPVFNAEFQAPLVITEAVKSWDGPVKVTYDNTGNSYEIDSIWNFPTGYWEPTEVNLSIRDLILSESKKSNLLSLRTSNINSVPLNLNSVVGHQEQRVSTRFFCDDFYTFFYRNSNIYTHENKREGKFYSLNSVEERDSLVSYLKTKFARFALALHKATNWNTVIRYVENVPLPPLDVKWTDELVYEYYGLSQEQINSIESFIPTYY